MTKEQAPSLCPSSPQQWREWLLAHHATERGAWLVYYKKAAGQPSLSWSEAVDEALCFGWIDSQAKPLDAQRYQQFFSPRKPTSGWSRINKQKVQHLTAAGRMTPAGLASVAAAQQNGTWALLDDVEDLRLPPDLAQALAERPAAGEYFARLSRTAKRSLLLGLALARQAPTRARRIAAILAQAEASILGQSIQDQSPILKP
ncbi:YdeI/OmpD-associated family protein [Hymenobacter bucti]|uniref:YdeI family protein n=1 Tax=Hymenobacter bucti TaxID=1844114 RepID=A0ABW4QVK3_9BACT